MDPTPLKPRPVTEIRPPGWSLEEIVKLSLAVYLRKFLALTVPALLAFSVLSLVDIALTAALGRTSMTDEAGSWTKWIVSTLLSMACVGAAIAADGHVVFRDLLGQPTDLKTIFQNVWKRMVPITSATFFYHLAVMLPAIPGFGMLWWSMKFSMHQRLLPAFGCILVAAVLLYWPFRLFLQMIFFAFPVIEEERGGWASLKRSRDLIRTPGSGGITGNNMFRVFVVLHISLMPALVVLFMACIPVVMMVAVYSLDQLIEDIKGHHISLPYLMVQALNVVVMTLIVPIFVAPLAVVYRDITNRQPKNWDSKYR